MSSKTAVPNTDVTFQHVASDRAALFHRLNNQLGIILANAELLETRLREHGSNHTRAVQIVGSALDALSTIQDIKAHTEESAE